MAIEVVVGPPLVTINRGDTFVLSEMDGCVTAYTDQGMYSRDTRYVSKYEIFADGERWVLQNSGALAYYASRTYLTNPKITTEYNDIEAATISLILDRAVSDCIHEDFDIHNYSVRRVRFSLELSLRSDFAVVTSRLALWIGLSCHDLGRTRHAAAKNPQLKRCTPEIEFQ